MVDGITFVAGVGVAALLLYLISIQLDEKEHGILKLFLMIGILSILLILPKVLGDAMTNCEPVVANSTMNNNTISYEYTDFCHEVPTTSVTTFMKVIFWIFRGIILYIIVYLFLQAIKILGVLRGKKNG